VEQADPVSGSKLHEQVDVAVCAEVSPGTRTEDLQPRDGVPAAQVGQQLIGVSMP